MFKLMIAFTAVVNAAVLKKPEMAKAPLMRLRGGMDLGPVTSSNFDGALKVAAAVTAAGAITEKFAGLDETTLTKLFKGDVWTTNVIISMVTGVLSTVVYSTGASGFDVAQLTSALWLLSVLIKVKDAVMSSEFNVSTITDNPVETGIAVLLAVMTFA